METKVFKIPDGEGGWTFKVQGPDGTWVETDEKGSPIQKDRDGLSGRSDVPKGRASRRAVTKDSTMPVHVNTGRSPVMSIGEALTRTST